tara:strand:- start:319 stop:717 length:399 start_codon:yes stop_codon:yes gene_type:complete
MLFFLFSCSETVERYGLSQKKIENIELLIGVTSKKSLINSYGPPVFESLFNENIVYYVSHESSFKNFEDRKTKKLKVIEVIFDKNDIVQNFNKYSEQDSIKLKVLEKETDDTNNGFMFWKEIISNLSKRVKN